jgi:hypothetical protein
MKHYLSLCAVFKNEAPYLHEWLRFYYLLGVEHFYLYDNESTDAPLAILTPWLASGYVTAYGTTGHPVQALAYDHCLKHHAGDSAWIMFVDLDEYLFAPAEPDLRVFLQAYENEAGVVANWLMFGANGHQHRPSGLTTLNFTRRCAADLGTFEPDLFKGRDLNPKDPANYYPICAHVKSIVNTRDCLGTGITPHDFRYREGRFAVNANHAPVRGPFCDDLSAIELLRINHYFSRSWEELKRKLRRGRADSEHRHEVESVMQRNLLFDQVEDRDIFPLARRVESDMQARKPPRKWGDAGVDLSR